MKSSSSLFSNIRVLIILLASSLVLSQLSCTKEGPAGPQGSSGAPDDLADPNILPDVLFTSPGSNAIGPFNLFTPAEPGTKPHFIVRFNKYILKSSASSRSIRCEGFDRPVAVNLFAPYPEVPTTRSLRVSSELYDNILEFTIDNLPSSFSSLVRMPYRVGRSYTIVIDTLIEDINGNHPVNQYRFSFTPEPFFRVVKMVPDNGTTNASQSMSAEILFNTFVDGSVFPSVQFSPPTVGQWSMGSDSTQVSFLPGAPLPFNTPCLLAVLSTAHDRWGNQINVRYSSSFSVTSFQVDRWYPTAVYGGVSPMSDIYVYFTGTLDYSTISQGWTIIPSTAGSLNQHYTNTAIWFRPTNGFVPATTYSVTLSTSIRAQDSTRLEAPFVFSFSTAPFMCTNSSPSYGQINVGLTNPWYFLFNSGVDTSTLRSSISISPPTDFDYTVNYDGTSLTVDPVAFLRSHTKYTVTISTGLRCKTGAYLGAQHVLVFTTG